MKYIIKKIYLPLLAKIACIYGYYIEEISGYNMLADNDKKMFDLFSVNFLNVQGLEARGDIDPLYLKFEKGDLIFGFKQWGMKTYLIITSNRTWD